MRIRIFSTLVCTIVVCGMVLLLPHPTAKTGAKSILDPQYPNGEDPMKVWNGLRTARPKR